MFENNKIMEAHTVFHGDQEARNRTEKERFALRSGQTMV